MAKSNTKKAKNIIRSEIRGYYGRNAYGGGASSMSNMRKDAEAAYTPRFDVNSDYHKARKLVDGGSFACYYDDQRKMLGRIYGKKNVQKWSGNKVHSTYGHLIAREYADEMRRQKKKR